MIRKCLLSRMQIYAKVWSRAIFGLINFFINSNICPGTPGHHVWATKRPKQMKVTGGWNHQTVTSQGVTQKIAECWLRRRKLKPKAGLYQRRSTVDPIIHSGGKTRANTQWCFSEVFSALTGEKHFFQMSPISSSSCTQTALMKHRSGLLTIIP